MKPNSCSPALAMAARARAGSPAAGAGGGAGRCAPGTPRGAGAARGRLLRGARLLVAAPGEAAGQGPVWVGAGVGTRKAARLAARGLRRQPAGRRDLKRLRPRPADRRAAPPGGFGAAQGESGGERGPAPCAGRCGDPLGAIGGRCAAASFSLITPLLLL